MYDSAINKYGLSDNGEFFINVEEFMEESPETIKAYIPKLMPNISLGESAVTDIKILVNPSIFVNAPDCAVTGIDPIVNGQNYLTLSPYGNQSPNFKAKMVTKEKETGEIYQAVEKHNKFLMEILHGDIGNMYFTDKI